MIRKFSSRKWTGVASIENDSKSITIRTLGEAWAGVPVFECDDFVFLKELVSEGTYSNHKAFDFNIARSPKSLELSA
jgi:hypothetical protein